MMISTARVCAAALSLALLVPSPPASAQPAPATLTVSVRDLRDTAIAGLDLIVRNEATGAATRLQIDDWGRVVLPRLAPGTYLVEVGRGGSSLWRGRAEVGVGQTVALEAVIGEALEPVTVEGAGRAVTSALDSRLSTREIETLPLNGRNFLELALLVPGNQPTPNFDPTKTNSVLVSSAGQLGRGGNVMVDGQDNNDDVVGGPLTNLPIDAVQEFQLATSRFGAELGRTGSSVVNIVTRSGSNTVQGIASLFARDGAWQARPATLDKDATVPPFDRQQISGALGGPLRRDSLFWFGAAEFRNQDGAVLVGARDTAARTIRRSFAPAPLDDALWSVRVDAGSGLNRGTVRYAGERATDTSASAVERAIGAATQRQEAMNRYHAVLGTWTAVRAGGFVNALNASVSTYLNQTTPTAALPQWTFPSIQDGASFRMPQETRQTRLQVADTATLVRGRHLLKAGGELQRMAGEFRLGVFRQGRVELVEDFPAFDRNGDGRVNDDDLLFAVTLRSGKPGQDLVLPDSSSTHVSGFAQDDWTVSDRLTVNLGLRYEFDTNVNNQSRVDELNSIVLPFVKGERRRDMNNLGPRAGFSFAASPSTTLRGGYGTYYDRIVLQIQSLERGLDGRALPVEVRAGNLLFMDPATGRIPAFAPTLSNPFTGFVLPGAGASGINIIDARLQNPTVHQFNLGVDHILLGAQVRVDAMHAEGRNFLIGRTVGEVFNPVVGGPDRVVNIESSARTRYDALLVNAERRIGADHAVRVGYTLAKALNYANDDQIPFLNGPIDPNNLARESGPTPNDRRHRLVVSGRTLLPWRIALSGLWTLSSAVPMDIMMPGGQTRIPAIQRNAGGRQFTSAAELNDFIRATNAAGGINGTLLPLVGNDARFGDSFNALDLRVSRAFALGSGVRVEPIVEVFNVFDVTNILGISNVNYSGFANVLTRDSDDPTQPGYLQSSGFGRPVTTAGGVFGSGGPRALQLAVRVTF
ncbi:MAG: TonB-dependent receptor [Vicinamibacterales bacterium]